MAEDERHPEGAEPPESAKSTEDENEAPLTDATEDESAAAGTSEAYAGPAGLTEDELRAALDRVGVSDVLVEALMATASLGFRRVSAEARDLPEARLAIETLRALEPVLREGGVDEALVRDLEQARMNLQLAYASAVAESGTPD